MIDSQVINNRTCISQLQHKNEIGTAAELMVQASMILKGFTPFTTSKASSEVDLIVEKNNRIYKVQVKSSICDEHGVMRVDLRKSNRKHKDYTKESFDLLAIVDVEKFKIAYFDWQEIYHRRTMTLRTNTYYTDLHKNTGSQGINIFDDYLDIPVTCLIN